MTSAMSVVTAKLRSVTQLVRPSYTQNINKDNAIVSKLSQTNLEMGIQTDWAKRKEAATYYSHN